MWLILGYGHVWTDGSTYRRTKVVVKSLSRLKKISCFWIIEKRQSVPYRLFLKEKETKYRLKSEESWENVLYCQHPFPSNSSQLPKILIIIDSCNGYPKSERNCILPSLFFHIFALAERLKIISTDYHYIDF